MFGGGFNFGGGAGGVTFDTSGGMGQGMKADVEEKKLKMWEQDFFTSDMCEALIRVHPDPYGDYASVMKQLLEEMLSKQLPEDARTGVIKMIQGLTRSEVMFRRRQQHRAWHIPFHLSKICDDICKQLHSSSVGDVHIFPFDASMPGLIVVEHERHGIFHAGVINTTPGSTDFLPYSAEAPPKVKMQTVLEIKNIPKLRITSEAFWACDLLSDCSDDSVVFTHFLPWLNNRTHAELLQDTPSQFSTGSKCEGGNLWKCFVHALKYCLHRANVPEEQVKALRLHLKSRLLQDVQADLKELESINHSSRLIINAATQNASMALTRNGRHLEESEFEAFKTLVEDVHKQVAALPCPDDDHTKPPPELNITEGWENVQQLDLWPLAECHRRLENVDDFIGTAVDQPRYVPVNFFKIAEKVDDFDEALLLLDEVVSICTRITCQMNVVKNAGFLISSLMTHVFTVVLPTPLGNKSRTTRKCLWDTEIKYGQQMHCMRRLWQCAEYFTWGSFSVKTTKEFDAQRIIVLGAMATIGDAVIRLLAKDHPSVISIHLRGYKRKPAFGVGVGKFASQTESSCIVYPQLLTTRCGILDYHAEQAEDIPASNVMWNWEEGWAFCKATQAFIRQLCMVEGFKTSNVMSYFMMERNGQYCLPGKYWDEYRQHRDLYILFKWMMAPKNKLPTCQSCLSCRVRTPEVNIDYGNHKLQVRWMHRDINAKALQLRFPSFAIPSKFTAPFEAGSEDDILHIKNLPTFDDAMGQRDSELLLSYLTAPYIRIPLILNFFATEDRVSCLGNTNIKNLVEAIMFEPGKFLPRSLSDKIPEQVPAEDSNMLGTPYGLLMNELQFSPQGVVQPLLKLVRLAREMDAGTIHNSSVVDIIMFLMRLVARVESFVNFSLELAADPNHTLRRGLCYDDKAVEELRGAFSELRELTEGALLPMLEAWNDEVMESVVGHAENARDIDKATRTSAQLSSHMLLLLRNVEQGKWSHNLCSIGLSATMFMTTRHTFNQDSLHVPESEVFDVLQLHRRNIVRWLYDNPANEMGAVMDSVVRVATSTGKRTEGTNFSWGYVAGEDCVGRFTRVDEETTKRADFGSKTKDLLVCMKDAFGYKMLPHDVTCINEGLQDVEINIHVLSLTFKAAHLVALPSNIACMADTRTIFSPKVGHNEHRLRSMQCAIIQDAEHRTWVRLVGQEHDIQYWKTQDPREPLPNDAMRFFPEDLTPSEDWIFKLVEPIRRAFFVRSFWQPPIFLLLPEHKLSGDQNTVVLSAVCSKTGKKLKEIVCLRDHEVVHIFELFSIGRRFYRRLIFTSNCHFSLRDLQPEIHDRRNMWQPWQRHAAGDCDADSSSEPMDSCVVLRHATHPDNVSKAVETFLPKRILEGLIPSALLETHTFWQDPDDNIRGYPNEKNAMHILWIHWKDATYDPIGGEAKQVCFQVFRFSRVRSCPKVSEQAVLKSQKLNIVDEMEEEIERLRTTSVDADELGEDPDLEEGMFRDPTTVYTPKAESATIEDYNLMLVNLMNAKKGTPLHSVAQLFARLELLSHVLCWTTQVDYDSAKGGAVTLDMVHLPRLKLTFSARVDSDGTLRMFSLDHAHLFVSNLRQPLVIELLQGIPHSVVLADTNDNVSIIVPALDVVRPSISNAPFSTELVVNRDNKRWYQKLDTRYYLYPVHVSLSFLFTPTLASSLYLLALRFFHCEYDDVFRLASTIGTDVEFSPEEQQNFNLLKFSDSRPEAHACRSKIGLLVADSPVTPVWFLPKHAAQMIRSYNSIGLSCKLNDSEERRLLYVCKMLLKKVDLISEIAKGVKEDILDTTISRINNKYPIFEGTGSERRQIRDFYAKIATSFREKLDVRITKDEVTRLLAVWGTYRRFGEFPAYYRCILDNRAAFLEAELKSIENNGEPVECHFTVPPLKKDELWSFYKDYDPMSVKIPEAQAKNKNDEGRFVRLSNQHDYFYCGSSVRKANMCKCHDCGEDCGPDTGCPCASCERFNKSNLNKLRYIPANPPSDSTRMISFYDAFSWIENVLGEDCNVRSQEEFIDPAIKAFSSQMRRWTMREYNNSFLRYYEMLTGTTKVRIGSGDCAKDLAALLFPMVHEARRPESALGHLTHYLLNNPQVWPKLPKYNRTSKTSFESRMTTIYSGIMQYAAQQNRKPEAPPLIELPSHKCTKQVVPRPVLRSDPFTPISTTRILPILSNTDCRHRVWGTYDIKKLVIKEGESIETTDATRNEIRTQILASIVPEGYLKFLSREEQKAAHVDSKLSFDLHKHDAAATSVAKSMIHRLEKDMEDFAGAENQSKFPKIVGLASHAEIHNVIFEPGKPLDDAMEGLNKLHTSLVNLREVDQKFVTNAFSVAERTLNDMNDESSTKHDSFAKAMMQLRRIANQEAIMSLSYLISCLACTTAEQDWMQLNPFLSKDVCQSVINLLTTAILRANRIGHINRCCESIKELLGMLGKAKKPPEGIDDLTLKNLRDALCTSVQQKADNIAGILATKRVYIDEDFSYDPRFLIFEFTWNLVLRSRQRALITEIYSSIMENQSIVKQMIMGAGKTTVVGPLLALMLADTKNLVIQVVPPALLDFTRSILRATFSCVIQKQIFCFSCDRSSEIDSEMLSKFHHAKQSRGIVVTTPSAIKSVFLKYIEGLDRIEDMSRKPLDNQEREVHDLGRVLRVWQDAVLIMDEVDMLLHPLKSELNFPIGAKHDLDFAPTRWKLPIHLIDALFYFHTRRVSVPIKESSESQAVLQDIVAVLRKGLGSNALQSTPHLTLLNLEFYQDEMMGPMARWLMLFLKAHHFAGLTDEETYLYITKRPSKKNNAELNEKVEKLEPDHVKTLNLAYEWLTAFLPHSLQKIDRVSFGIMNADDMKRAREEHPNMPRSRYVTAIPFIGKDLPSQSSEFAHPDVVIGLTVLAYRYEGLRRTDFTDIMREIHAAVEKEVGRFHQRRTNVMYNRWVGASGGRILSNFAYGDKKEKDEDEMGMQPSESMSMALMEDENGEPIKKGQMDVLPLKLMKQANKDESDKLYKLFRRTAEVIHWYLCEHIFPEYMRHQKKKLSASGQELGGNILFKRRIGFSGTPSDLLPYELGKCEYEPGTDGKLVYTLTSPQIMSYSVAQSGWTVRSLLDFIANASPPFHALIDTGALITGMSNLQVAQYLLKHGLSQMEGVVFLDEFDRKMILVRATGRVLKLAECGIPKVKRFAFYDQVHTTGMDIDHTPNAQAVQTLGKDMTFRDFAQGAYRMRGIGNGQTVHLMLIPEVHDLINRTLQSMRSEADTPKKHSVLNDVVAWLLVNSIRSEHTQHNQLCLQTISNVWRKEAYQTLLESQEAGTFKRGANHSEQVLQALRVYREPVDYTVPEIVPQPRMFSEAVKELTAPNEMFITSEEGKRVVGGIIEQTTREDEIDNPVIDVQMVQEQEEEREVEAEKDKEQQIEMEKFVDLAYSRDEEVPIPWAINSLRDPARCVQFYKLNEFHLYKRRPLAFPGNISLSRNYFNPKWAGHRRIKNVIVTMEWIPSLNNLALMEKPSRDFGEIAEDAAHKQLGTTVSLLKEHQGNFDKPLVQDFVDIALGHPEGVTEEDWHAVDDISEPKQLHNLLSSNFLRREESGRQTVALALCEAETVRRVIHAKRIRKESFIEGSDTQVCLNVLPANNIVLDQTISFRPPQTNFQRQRAFQTLRFFDSDLHYSDQDINYLLRSLHVSAAKLRQAFFLQVITCRRRARQRWERTPVSLLFNLDNPYSLVHQKSIGLCMRRDLEAKDMHLGDAYLAMNTSHSGQLSPDEVWGGLRYCRLNNITADDVLDFIQIADTHHEGTVQYPDFLAMLTGNREIDDDEGNPSKDDTQGKHLPTVDPYGADELKDLRAAREKSRRAQEEEANREMESEEKRVREEIEAELMKEELALIQTADNPKLLDASLHFNYQAKDIPKLSKFLGAVLPKQFDEEGGPLHFNFSDNGRVQMMTRSIKLLTENQDPFLSKYMLTCEFRLPRPVTMSGKTSKHPLLTMMDDEGEYIHLFSFNTNVWTLGSAKNPNAEPSDDDSDDDYDSYDSYDDYDDDDEDYNTKLYVYSKPDKTKKNRLFKVVRDDSVEEQIGERLSTSSGAVSIEWMKIKKPVEGWVIFDEGGTRYWNRERVDFDISKNGQLEITNIDEDLNEDIPPTVFEDDKKKEEESDDSDDEFWNWRFSEWADDIDDDEETDEDEMENNYDMGDITDLAAAVKRAKELKVGDKVSRNPECWDRGNEDGGEGTRGKVTKVNDNRVHVTWPNGFKSEYKWGEGGKFELKKVGSADDDDDWGRDIVNDDKFAPDLKKKGGKNRCNSCSTAVSMEANNGWFKCNQCSVQLCKKCFKNMEHPEHDFTDMYQLSELIKSTMIVRGSTVRINPDLKEPKNGWQDAPRDGTPGTVVDLDEDVGSVQVNFSDEMWFGQLSEVVVVDAKFESYATTWLGTLFNHSGVDKRELPAFIFTVDQQLIPPKIEGKFKVGEKIKARWKGSRVYPGEIRAVLPNSRYAVAFDDGDFDDKCKEENIWANPFTKGSRIRLKGRTNHRGDPYFTYSLQKGVTKGMTAEVTEVYHYSGTRLRLRCKIRNGMKVITQNVCDDEVELAGQGKWSWIRRKKDAAADDESEDAFETIPLPNSANVIIERAFGDGIVSTELFIKDGTYQVNFEEMQLINPKTHQVMGKVARTPDQPWVKQRERINFDDGKWHVMSVIINGNEDVQAFCDGKVVPVQYDAPNDELSDDDDDGGSVCEEDEEDEEKHADEAEAAKQKARDSETDEAYADRVNLPEIFDHISKELLAKKPDDVLACTIDALENNKEELIQAVAPSASAPTATAEKKDKKDGSGSDDEEGSEDDSEGDDDEVQKGWDTDAKDAENAPIPDGDDDDEEDDAEEKDDDESSSSESGTDDDDDSDDDSDDEEDGKIKHLKRLRRKPIDVLSLDVRNGVTCMAGTCSGYSTKYGNTFPTKNVACMKLHWNDEANKDTSDKLFKDIDDKTNWHCAHCTHKNSRLLDDCAECGKERFESEDKADGKKRKVRAVLPKSKEAADQRKRMHARLRALYQKQLAEMETQMASIL